MTMSTNTSIPMSFLWHPVHFLALGLGSGMPRVAPGTFGTLMGLMLFCGYHYFFAPPSVLFFGLFLLVSSAVGIYLCGKTAKDLGVHDHGGIVWDEFVGFWLCLWAMPVTWYWVVAAFILFRIFDIAKPWPIKWIDHKVSGGFGIMLDDILAGLYVLVILHFSHWLIF